MVKNFRWKLLVSGFFISSLQQTTYNTRILWHFDPRKIREVVNAQDTLFLAIIAQSTNDLCCTKVLMIKIALWINIRANDWTAERVIIASNDEFWLNLSVWSFFIIPLLDDKFIKDHDKLIKDSWLPNHIYVLYI